MLTPYMGKVAQHLLAAMTEMPMPMPMPSLPPSSSHHHHHQTKLKQRPSKTACCCASTFLFKSFVSRPSSPPAHYTPVLHCHQNLIPGVPVFLRCRLAINS